MLGKYHYPLLVVRSTAAAADIIYIQHTYVCSRKSPDDVYSRLHILQIRLPKHSYRLTFRTTQL